MKQVQSRITTPAERKRFAAGARKRTAKFGKRVTDKYASAAQKRVDAFAKKTGVV